MTKKLLISSFGTAICLLTTLASAIPAGIGAKSSWEKSNVEVIYQRYHATPGNDGKMYLATDAESVKEQPGGVFAINMLYGNNNGLFYFLSDSTDYVKTYNDWVKNNWQAIEGNDLDDVLTNALRYASLNNMELRNVSKAFSRLDFCPIVMVEAFIPCLAVAAIFGTASIAFIILLIIALVKKHHHKEEIPEPTPTPENPETI